MCHRLVDYTSFFKLGSVLQVSWYTEINLKSSIGFYMILNMNTYYWHCKNVRHYPVLINSSKIWLARGRKIVYLGIIINYDCVILILQFEISLNIKCIVLLFHNKNNTKNDVFIYFRWREQHMIITYDLNFWVVY